MYPATTGDLREQGTALLKEKKFDAAVASLKQAATENPGDEAVWRLLGVAYSSLNTPGGHENAQNAFERVVTLAPAAARNHFNLAVAEQALGNMDAARQSLERALALEPTYEQARVRLESLPAAVALVPAAAPSLSEGTTNLGGGNGNMAGLSSVGSVFAPPQADNGGTTNIGSGGGNTMGLMGVGEDRGFAAPPPPFAPAPPSSGDATVPPLRSAGSVPNAPTGSVFYDQMSRAESNAYLGGAYGISNTSGMQGTVPPEIAGGFNLGAAVFPFWWLRTHNLPSVSIAFIVFYILVGGAGSQVQVPGLVFLPGIVQIVLFFTMGFMGNRIGWQNRKWDDEDDFRACQRVWALWAIPRILFEVLQKYFAFVAAQNMEHLMRGGGLGHGGF